MTYASPLGPLSIAWSRDGLTACHFSDEDFDSPPGKHGDHARRWLDAYFAREKLPPLPALDLRGTPFQNRVWRKMTAIDFGCTLAYGELARAVGNPGATRAVGTVCGKNPLPLFVPCHRILASGGRLGGFSAGVDKKDWLLAHEAHGYVTNARPSVTR